MIYFIFLLVVILVAPSLIYFILRPQWLKRAFVTSGFKSQFAEIDGDKIHFTHSSPSEESGDSKNVILIHGIGANVICWRHVQKTLGQKHKVWAIDLRGFGLSDKPFPYNYNLENQSQLVLKFISDVIKGPAYLVGNSMGGAISLEAALRDKTNSVSGLILLAPAYDSQAILFDPRRISWILNILPWLANPFLTSGIVKKLYGTKGDTSNEVVMAYLRPFLIDSRASKTLFASFECLVDKSLRERIRDIKIPTLAIWGARDHLLPVKFSDALPSIIAQTKLIVHPTGGHHIQEEEPEWVTKQIDDFLKATN